MKKYILAVALLAGILMSCEDAIDIRQVGTLDSDAAFETLADLESGLFALYDEFDNTQAIQFNASFTDEISIGYDNGGQALNYILTPQSAFPSSVWFNYYRALNSASRLIEASALVDITSADQDAFDDLLGQAYALRAYAHFELITYFSPDLTDNSAPGVILLNFVPTFDQQLPRATTGEIFTAIEADLAQATSLLSTVSSATFVSLDFITALEARMALYREDYATAAAKAEQLTSKYSLADSAQYVDTWTDTDNTEIIFKLERTVNDNYDGQGSTGSAAAGGWAGANFAFVSADIDGSPYFEASILLDGLLAAEDVRRGVLFHPTSTNDTLMVGKYTGSEGEFLMNDLKIFRSSEMLLIRAEAAVANNDLAGAAALIEELRDARFSTDQPTPSYGSAQEAWADILLERRLEFAFEGFRWVDLKRIGEKAGLTTLNRDAGECSDPLMDCSIELSDIKMNAAPVPLFELDANENVEQTPGY